MLLVAPVLPQQHLRLKTSTSNQPFSGKYKFSFWAYVGVTGWEGTAAKVPDIHVNIGGDKVSIVMHSRENMYLLVGGSLKRKYVFIRQRLCRMI